ncbi:uncharacterized protein LOC111274039 [Durio zibethinus]|uniref:Uncharacterized protein LOC111274039 n=1 Tax=Durio zibethinus TaxID=66656 RepID=A0A6P5WEB4_DURZI|nr:uncharacterized protein LOC111274039 [Durio zibethinus]
MDGVDRERRRRSFKERLGFKVMGCCGTTWGFGSTTMSVRDDDEVEVEEQEQQQEQVETTTSGHNPNPGCINPVPVSSGMNLASALAAERHFRAAQEPERGNVRSPTSTRTGNVGIRSPGTPVRVSLVKLLEEAEGGGGEEEKEKSGVEIVSDSMCCVCVGRKKGAAFIPCGHTFCRVCSRELWLNRGCCPLCNRSILEILDIF